MTWLDLIPWGLSGVLGLAGFVGIWYYKSRWASAQQTIQALTDTGARWAAQNDLQAKRIAATEAALTARQDEERKNDQTTAKTASGDVNLASDLLNQLHTNQAGASSSNTPSLPSDASPRVSGFTKPSM